MDQIAPPTSQSVPPYVHTEAPRWPSVVGTISIVWASLNLACGGCGLLSPVLMGSFVASAEARMGPMPEVMKPGVAQLAMGVVTLLWAIMLLVAGIMLTLRRPAARPLHLVYAIGSIVISVAGTVATILVQQQVSEWVAANPDNAWAANHNPSMMWVSLGVGIVLGLAWPAFCLIWFGFVKKTAASIAGADAPGAFDAA